jgi:uncharacterized protein (TIRG00374 family)
MMEPAERSPDRAEGRSPWVRRVLLAAAYTGIAWLVARTVDPHRFLDALDRLRFGALSQVLVLVAFHLGARSLRYHCLVVRAHPVGYRLGDGVRIFLAGLAVSLVTPARAGDVLKVELTRAYGIRRAVSLGIVVVERILDLLVITATVVVAGALLSERWQSRGTRWAAAVLLAGLVGGTVLVTVRSLRWRTIAIFARLVARLTTRIPSERVIDACHRIFDVWDEVFTSPAVAVRYFVGSAVLWLADFSKLWLLLRCTGADVPLLCVLFVYPLSLIVGILTFLPFSDGVVGVTVVALLGRLTGISVDTATAAILVDRGFSTLAPVVLYGAMSALRASPWSRRQRSSPGV